MSISVSSASIASLKVGGSDVSSVMLGGDVVYSSAVFSPASLSGLSLWFDASDAGGYTVDSGTGGVSAWQDKSVNGWDVTQSDSTKMPATASYGGLNWIDFAGVEDLLASASVLISPPFSVWIVAKLNNTNSTFHYVDGYNDSNERFSFRVGKDVNNDAIQVFTRNIDEGDGNGLESFYSSGLSLGTSPHLLQVTHGGDVPQGSSIWLNGTEAATGTTGSERLNGLIVGNWINAAVSPLSLLGYVGELLVVSGVVTTGNRQQIEGYLSHKWGLDSTLPTDHPYKSSPPSR